MTRSAHNRRPADDASPPIRGQERAEVRLTKKSYLRAVANHSGVHVDVVTKVYASMVEVLLDRLGQGHTQLLTGFGKFFLSHHKGHQVHFTRSGDEGSSRPSVVEDYMVVNFTAAKEVKRRLRGSVFVK